MATKKKLLEAAAGSAGGGGLNVEDVFSTDLWSGTGATTNTITNGIDISGEGGLVWVHSRSRTGEQHILTDTENGQGKALNTASTGALTTTSESVQNLNSDGYSFVGDLSPINRPGATYVGWTFRKAPKFFDVVTYTGDGTSNRAIPHNLGTTPGFIIIKCTTLSTQWYTSHRSLGTNDYILLNGSAAKGTNSSVFPTAHTDTHFYVGSDGDVNDAPFAGTNREYVAYLFAHNNGDGDFGDGTQDIIKCGSFTEGASGASIDLGFEPQFLLFKRSSGTSEWYIVDAMRGMPVGGTDVVLNANSSAAEGTIGDSIDLTPTGFNVNPLFGNTQTSIYIAIRRGPMAVPTSATEVFDVEVAGTSSSTPRTWNSGFPVDLSIYCHRDTYTSNKYVGTRLTGNDKYFTTASTSGELSSSNLLEFDHSDKIIENNLGSGSNKVNWMWKRAPSFFDVVAYTGNGTAGHTVSHNLGVAPEMWIVKRRDAVDYWVVGTSVRGSSVVELDNSNAEYNAGSAYFSDGTSYKAPTESEIFLGSNNRTNISGGNFIAYLFASLDGISKVGSYTGNGSTQNIDCGFSSGARFVLIKRTNDIGSWWVFDTERGIVAGSDAYLKLNDTAAEGSAQAVNPYSGGFGVDASGLSSINGNGDTFIFYAIA